MVFIKFNLTYFLISNNVWPEGPSLIQDVTFSYAVDMMIGELYVHEIVKYITTVTIGENVLDMTQGNVPIESLVAVFESMPMSVSKAITQRIKKARKPELKALEHATLPSGDTITLDSTLFVPGE